MKQSVLIADSIIIVINAFLCSILWTIVISADNNNGDGGGACLLNPDFHISRIPMPTDNEMIDMSILSDKDCYSHLVNYTNDIGISNRSLPVIWSSVTSNMSDRPHDLDAELSEKEINFYEENGFLTRKDFWGNDSNNDDLFEHLTNLASYIEENWKDLIINESYLDVSSFFNLSAVGSGCDEECLDLFKSTYVIEPSGNQIRSVYSIHSRLFGHLDYYQSLIFSNPKILSMVESIVGSKVYISQSRLNFQSAVTGTGFFWHSDYETWHSEDGMPLPRSVSLVITLDSTHEYSGALMVIPGSHKYFVHCFQFGNASNTTLPDEYWETSLAAQDYGVPNKEQLQFLYDNSNSASVNCNDNEIIKYIKMGKNDISLFDSNLMHGSHSNISPLSRKSLFIVYNSVENKYVDKPYVNKNGIVRPWYLGTRGEKGEKAIEPFEPFEEIGRSQCSQFSCEGTSHSASLCA